MNFILAVSEDGVIGLGSKSMPWKIHEEYAYFLQKVQDKVLVSGRKTWEILKTCPFWKHVYVLTTSSSENSHSVNEKTTFVRDLETIGTPDTTDIWCVGGRTLYEQIETLNPARVYMTTIKQKYDTHHPTIVKLSPSFFETLEKKYKKYILSYKCLFDHKTQQWVDCEFSVYRRI